jgi:type III pantothenate kinase
MILLIETSPTRFKYSHLLDGQLTHVEVLVGGSSAAEPPWAPALARLAPTPSAVFVANTSVGVLHSRLAEWIRRAWHVEPHFVTPRHDADPSAPVERYLALVGARARSLLPALIVTADTTVGIDLLGPDGNRLGAWTLPGERPMHEALYAQTSGVAAAALLDPADVEGCFGVNTSGAVQAGARLAIASCVAALAKRQKETIQVVGTGRFALEAVRSVSPSARILEDLALEGLAHLVTEGLV